MMSSQADPRLGTLSACLDTPAEMFFPERGGSVDEAKAVCSSCRIREACLEYAIANNEQFGIWGGHTERERRRIRRAMALSRMRQSTRKHQP